jgi:hypothetical protein
MERLPYLKASLLRARKTMNDIYLVVQQLGEPIPGLNFILGTAFMERYCIVFDTAGRHVGFAKPACYKLTWFQLTLCEWMRT